jgi:hypothetical protein
MQDDEENNDTHSFILRIWYDATPGNGKRRSWRGSIIDVGSGKRIYFHNLNSIKDFIQKQTGIGYGALGGWLNSIFDRARQK